MIKNLLKVFTLILTIQAAFAMYDVKTCQDGYLYTDLHRSRIYFYRDGETEILLEGPGVGYYYTLSPDERYIGFKWRKFAGGKEAPALYDIASREVKLLHEPVDLAGQPSFFENGGVAYTIAEILYVIQDDKREEFQLKNYASLAPVSPDGNAVVYNDNAGQLWIMNLKNNHKTRITHSAYGNVFPSWSPDSRHIAYNRLDGILFIYDTHENKTREAGRGAGFCWSPDGAAYAYTHIQTDADGAVVNSDVRLCSIDGKVLMETKGMDGEENNPWFMKNGSLVYLQNEEQLSVMDNQALKKNTNASAVPKKLSVDPFIYEKQATAADTYLEVPYIHQVYDTPGPRGYSSCAPTSAAMVLAYYGLLPKWPFKSGFNNVNDYGAYVHERYYYNGTYFNQARQDCNTAETVCYTNYGGYGYMWTGGSPNSKMNNYYGLHGLSGNQTWNTSWSVVASEIDKEQPFTICNFLSNAGHLIVGIGRSASDQRTVIANDPYGDRNRGTWPNYYGKVVYYDWPGYNHGHASLNYANSGYTTMPWCIATDYTAPAPADSLVGDKHFSSGFYMKAEGNTVPMRYYHSSNTGHDGHHWWTYTESGTADICYVTWTPQLDKSGYYEIKAYIPDNATAENASYRVRHAAGEAVVSVDQSNVSNNWVSLGKYLFAKDTGNHVYLGDSSATADRIIAFDAMQWNTAEVDGLDFIADTFFVNPGYDINFSIIPGALPAGDYEYFWNFGDGKNAIGETVLHNYSKEGIYDVILTAKASGAELNVIHKNYIMILDNPRGDFELVSPDSMELITNPGPWLMWEKVPQAEEYLIYIGETLNFDMMTPLSGDSNIYKLSEKLPENKTIYWHVKAVQTGGDTLSSTIWRFEVNAANSAPAAFLLDEPAENAILDTIKPCFSWEHSSDADPRDSLYYVLYLGAHPDSMYSIYSGTENNCYAEAHLRENGNYRWYVEAVDRSGARTRSTDIRHFAINTVNEAPGSPVQLAPLHNSYQTTRYPNLEWTAVSDPDPGDVLFYRVYYGSSESAMNYMFSTENTSYNKRSFPNQRSICWTVAAIDKAGLMTYSDTLTFYVDTELEAAEIPAEFALENNYPNPFNPVTRIAYRVPEHTDVNITLYDLSGKRIRVLVNGEHQAGNYSLHFDASGLPSAVYIYAMRAGDFYQSRKMLLMK